MILEEIEEYLEQEEQREKIKESNNVTCAGMNPINCFFCFLMNILYFAHSSIIGEIGFNPTLNQVLVSSSEFTPLVLLVYS